MAKKQTRRTVSLGVNYYARLVEYASANHASASQVVEFALDAQLKAPLEPEAFRAWRGDRARESAVQSVINGGHVPNSTTLAAYHKREHLYAERVAKAAKAIDDRETAEQERRAKRSARLERLERRARIRTETGVSHLCKHCDGSHYARSCPTVPYVPLTTGSRGERAALAVLAETLTLREAAARFGITHQAVSNAWGRLFPGKRPPRSERDQFAHAVVVEMVRAGKSIAEIAEETGFSENTIPIIARAGGVKASAVPGRDAAFESAIAAVVAGASLGEAAADHGVSWGRLRERCRDRGVKPSGHCGPNGRAVAAAALVQNEGISVSAAARRMRCAPPAVSTVLRKRSA